MAVSRVRTRRGGLKEVRDLDVESRGEAVDVVEADVPFAPLNAPDVCAMQIDIVRERLLAEAKTFAKRPDSQPERDTLVEFLLRDFGHESSVDG